MMEKQLITFRGQSYKITYEKWDSS